MIRQFLKPGITGWAQINGRDEISIVQKVQLEQEYLYKKSFLFDVEIIFFPCSLIKGSISLTLKGFTL